MNALIAYERLLPQAMGLRWEPWLVWLWAGADLIIVTACVAIPAGIGVVLKRRDDLAHRGLISLFAGSIILFGVAHAVSIVALWFPVIPVLAAVKLAAGAVSIAAAAAMFRLIPGLVRSPAPEKHEEVIAQLEVAVAELAIARTDLQGRLARRTEALNDANLRMEHSSRAEFSRSRNLIQVISTLTQPGVASQDRPEAQMRDLRGRVNALATATSTVMEQEDGAMSDIERAVRRQVEPLFSDPETKLSVEGEWLEIGVQGAQQISLIAWELGGRFAQMNRWELAQARIAVTWKISDHGSTDGRDASAGPTCTLEWREILKSPPGPPVGIGDRGKGSHGNDAATAEGTLTDTVPITPEPLDSFSESLLTQIIPRLLGGKARIDLEPSTLVYSLTCPLVSLQSR